MRLFRRRRKVRDAEVVREAVGSDRDGFNQIVMDDGTSKYFPNTQMFRNCRFEGEGFLRQLVDLEPARTPPTKEQTI